MYFSARISKFRLQDTVQNYSEIKITVLVLNCPYMLVI